MHGASGRGLRESRVTRREFRVANSESRLKTRYALFTRRETQGMTCNSLRTVHSSRKIQAGMRKVRPRCSLNCWVAFRSSLSAVTERRNPSAVM
jgi:hypothetical protein